MEREVFGHGIYIPDLEGHEINGFSEILVTGLGKEKDPVTQVLQTQAEPVAVSFGSALPLTAVFADYGNLKAFAPVGNRQNPISDIWALLNTSVCPMKFCSFIFENTPHISFCSLNFFHWDSLPRDVQSPPLAAGSRPCPTPGM